MSTRSRIGIEEPDGTIRSVYCHHDGYPSGVGATLLAHFNSALAAQSLIDLGDLSSCSGPRVAPPGAHSGGVVSYRRWRNEEGTEARTCAGRAEYPQQSHHSGGNYAYLWGPNGWEGAHIPWSDPASATFLPVAELIKQDEEEEEDE